MMDSLNLEYLEAMGIDVYQAREDRDEDVADPDHQLIELGEGEGDILCVVANQAQAQLKLAAGIASAMRCPPIWAWPLNDESSTEEGQSLTDAVSERLTTRVLIFGESLANEVLDLPSGAVISAARVHVVPSLEQVGQDKQAKRSLWKLMLDNGIAASRKPGQAGR